MKTGKLLEFTLSALLCATAFAAAPKPIVRSGNWWKEKSGLYKEAFISGYKAGIAHGSGKNDILKFGTNELLDGLNVFYGDFRNRNIILEDALPYVEDQLSGVSDEKLKPRLEKMREAALAGGDE